jgi:nitrate/nitrite transport system substrate-binding protein
MHRRRAGDRPGDLAIGIMPLVDAAPIVVAERLGYFAEQGLGVCLHRERTWAAVRDKLIAGVLDAAHILAPMPLAAALGLDGVAVPLVTAMVLSRNDNAITLSRSLHDRLLPASGDRSPLAWARAIAAVVDIERRRGAAPLVFAHVFPASSHALQLRYWLAAAGVDVARDVTFVVVPPAGMAEQLRGGRIDGFCVGAPWSAVSEQEGSGQVVVQCRDIWPDCPEKVLGVTRAWAQEHPDVHVALVRALIDATRWLGQPGNLDAAARMLAADGYLAVSPALLRTALAAIRFDGDGAQRPWASEMLWLATQLQRWAPRSGPAPTQAVLREVAQAACVHAVHDVAARASGLAMSPDTLRMEGPWFDGARFDPWRDPQPAPG